MSQELRARASKAASLGRMGTVEEVAHAAVFLAENHFVNGTTVTIDGGNTYE